MKKNQYVIGICAGIFIGAIFALMIGNTTTAILAGMVSAGFTAWIASLQWSEARKFASNAAIDINVKNHLQNIANLGYGVILGTGKVVKWLLLTPIKLVAALITDVNARKMASAGIIIMSIYSTYMLFVLSSLTSLYPLYRMSGAGVSELLALLSLFLGLVPVIVIGIISVCFVLTICIDIPLNYGVITPSQAERRRMFSWNNKSFLLDWFYQLIQDDRGAVAAIARMLYIRTGNALRIIAYPFILTTWGAVALANNKTGTSALAAMILSGLHLFIAHLAGGINADNTNFWLSLIVAMGLGTALGRKVNTMRESSAHRPLPSINFRDQVALHRSR